MLICTIEKGFCAVDHFLEILQESKVLFTIVHLAALKENLCSTYRSLPNSFCFIHQVPLCHVSNEPIYSRRYGHQASNKQRSKSRILRPNQSGSPGFLKKYFPFFNFFFSTQCRFSPNLTFLFPCTTYRLLRTEIMNFDCFRILLSLVLISSHLQNSENECTTRGKGSRRLWKTTSYVAVQYVTDEKNSYKKR